jgi:hypothetical protein
MWQPDEVLNNACFDMNSYKVVLYATHLDMISKAQATYWQALRHGAHFLGAKHPVGLLIHKR